MGGGFVGDFVGGGAGAANLAIRAAMAEALPDDLGVFAAAFSFLAASSRALALAIISATPIFAGGGAAGVRRAVHPFFFGVRDSASTELRCRLSRQHWGRPGGRVWPEAVCGP